MDLQQSKTLLVALASIAALLVVGCRAGSRAKPATYSLVAVGPADSSVRMYRSANHLLYTTLYDVSRVGPIMSTLEASHAACVELTGIRPAADSKPQSVFVFELRSEWEAFTRTRAGAAAPVYLQLDRGGYTLGNACVVRNQGEQDTLTVLAHEELHLFIANRFAARPPPFIEEGLAALLENVEMKDDVAEIKVGRSASRSSRLAMVDEDNALMPLRTLLSMHAGNVVGLSGTEVDAFYAQAWAFVRFLREGEDGRHRPALERLLADAARGALSSESMSDNPALVERYLGQSLEAIEPDYRRFARRIGE